MNYEKDVTWQEISPGGMITESGNATKFKTGDWRSEKPIWIKENCKFCALCFPVCPDSSVIVNEEGNMQGFDYDHCKGCGVCAVTCPFKAIEMENE